MDETSPKRAIQEKLLEVDQCLSQAQHEGVSFLCAALVPPGKLYDHSLDSPPSVPRCFSALDEHRETQLTAASILIHALTFVGCNQQLVTGLQHLIHGAQESAANARSTPDDEIHASLSDEARQKLHLRELLHDVHEDLPMKDKKALMHLSVCYLKPARNANYTPSLFVHFAHLIEQEVITPSNVQYLHHWLDIMGKQTTLKKIDSFCRTASIPIPKGNRIERYNVYSTSASASVPMSASPLAPLSESVTMSSPSIQETGYSDQMENAAALSVDSDYFPQTFEATSASPHVSTEALVSSTNSSATHPGLPKQPERRGLELSIPHGPVVPDKGSSVTQDASSSAERGQDKVGEITAIRFSDDAAYIRWSSGCPSDKFSVTIQDKHSKRSRDVQSNQLVLTKLRPDTCYKITVSGLSQGGVCVWSSTLPIPSNEKPSGIRVTGQTSASMTVEWNRMDLLEVEGYRVQYTSENGSDTRDVSGAGSNTVTLTGLQPGTEYTVQVAALYEEKVVGPYSDSVSATVSQLTHSASPTVQGSTPPGESPEESPTTRLLAVDPRDANVSDYGATGEPPGQSSSPPPQNTRNPWRKCYICCCAVSIPVLLLLMFACLTFLLVYYLYILQPVTVHREVRGNTTSALYTADAFKYHQVDISSEGSIGPVEVYSGAGSCNEIPVSSKPYSFEWQMNATDMLTYPLTSDYFGHNSELIFQTNVTGQVNRTNCSAAVYLFDNHESYCHFLEYDTTENFMHKVCFNLSTDGSGYNHPQTYSIRESDYLYLGLYLPPIGIADHVALRISGVQNYYNRSELTNQCNISLNNPTCSFALSTKSFVRKPTTVCILGHWKNSNTETRNMQIKLAPSFWQNLFCVMLFSLCAIFFVITIILVFSSFVYFCHRRPTYL